MCMKPFKMYDVLLALTVQHSSVSTDSSTSVMSTVTPQTHRNIL